MVLDRTRQALGPAGIKWLNGSYAGCVARSGSWSVRISGDDPMDNPPLSVVRADTGCQLSVTSLVADQPYTASPSIALTTSYQASASPFTGGSSVAFYGNAKLGATSFDDDFVLTVLFSTDPIEASGSVTATLPLTYGDITQAANWSTFDSTTVLAGAKGYAGGTFDGRYMYFAPLHDGTAYHGRVMRYDTQAAFGAAGSWSSFDVTSIDPSAKGYYGAGFDQRYVYFVPHENGTQFHGHVVRYDTQADFTTAGSWSTFDTSTVDASTRGFQGSAFDGRYLYLVPIFNGSAYTSRVVRYDTQATFTAAASWSVFDVSTVKARAAGFSGAVFDGRYVYLVPFYNGFDYDGIVARYDTQASFTAAGSWATFDVATVNAAARGYLSASFDGRYLYLTPFHNGATAHGIVARYDTQASFAAAGSWSTFDTSAINANARGFFGSTFDGRYVYLTPFTNGASHGNIVRYDTTGSFGAAGSWSTFDTTSVTSDAKLFTGAIFDGRYVVLIPNDNGRFTRFDAKVPPSMPALPSYFGSFF